MKRVSLIAVCLLIGAPSAWAAGKAAPRAHERIPVTVRVDFGPANKPTLEQQVLVNQGSTPKDVLSLLVPIQSGEVCCDTREVLVVDGVRPDPSTNRWWTCRVNRSTTISPHQTELQAGDQVEWLYREVPQ